jgi:putative ABC transport system ATP-binding protein
MYMLDQVTYRHILRIDKLHIPKGLVTCITGESGSGKSTLLRLFNQLISSDGGTIRFRGRSIEAYNPVELRRMAVMVPQQPILFGDTVQDNLLAGLGFADKPAVSATRMEEALQQVRLSKDLATEAGKLSGGEKQRLSLARALLMDPDVFLLDEPSSALDEGTEDLVIGAFAASARSKGQTLIMVTHSKRIAEEYGDLIVEIHEGQVAGTRLRKETVES